MKTKELTIRALTSSLGTALYVFLVSLVIQNGDKLFGHVSNLFAPLIVLLLFVFSALVCSWLILGKPITLYLDGKKKESLRLLFCTGALLFIILIILLATITLINY